MVFSSISVARLTDLPGRSGQRYALWNTAGVLRMTTPAWCQWLEMDKNAGPIGQPPPQRLHDRIRKTRAGASPPPGACARNMRTPAPVIPLRCATAAYNSRGVPPMPRAGMKCRCS
ncbi:hypothetical protein [Comamonas sp.]|uniref:hypothetical protein n=1 Tax=Comamonas sp. TaxID=34028 RepID=UPI0012BE1BDC|nr:hypothetical protein [Comamonas sp.]MPS92699.1 hypothetical protein [Comamonas sp.]